MSTHRWTTNDIPDQTGSVIVITGANSGIGFEAAKALAGKRAQVVMACRNATKAADALAALKRENPEARAEVMLLDLSSLESIRAFADAFVARYDRLDVLLNNAGIMVVPYATTEDGFESQLGTNHLGHFALTGRLLEPLRATPGARVVNVSSMAHHMGRMDFDNLMYADGVGYSPIRAYGRSKLANLLFTYELQRRFEAAGMGTQALAAHPGSATTNLSGHLTQGRVVKALAPLFTRFFAQSAARGALPMIRAAVDPNARGGEYYGPSGFMEQQGDPVLVKSNAVSHRIEDALRLWETSEQLTGVSYL